MVPYPSRIKRIVSIPPYWLTHAVYRIQVTGTEHLPESGGALLIGNHLSYVDVVVLQAGLPRAIRYMGASWLFERPLLRSAMRWFDVVPVASSRPREALRRAATCLRNGEVVCLFPEGGISVGGELKPFKSGFSYLARIAGVPVVPFHISGLWGSMFSYYGGRLFSRLPRRLRPQVRISLGAPLKADEMEPESARSRVLALAERTARAV